MNTASHSQIGQYGRPYLGGATLPKDTYKYCKLLKNNVNSTNYCGPKDCYYTTDEWLNMPWMKKGVKPTDHAEFSIHNRISSDAGKQYFGGDYNRLNYSSYTPFQFDPTWNEFKNPKKFPNGCRSLYNHRFV